MGLFLAVTSGKGGTGKSTFSFGLSIAFNNLGKKVLLIDMDEALRCLDIMLGIESDIVFDLADILNGKEISDAVYNSEKLPKIDFIAAPSKFGQIDSHKFYDFISKIKYEYEVIILDFPAGMDFSLYEELGNEARFLVVSNPDPISVRDAMNVCNSLPHSDYDPRLIINKFDADLARGGKFNNIDDIIDGSGLQLIGIVPFEQDLFFLPIYHNLKSQSRSLKALNRIALRICGQDIKLPRIRKI